jgi:hypothetical protein
LSPDAGVNFAEPRRLLHVYAQQNANLAYPARRYLTKVLPRLDQLDFILDHVNHLDFVFAELTQAMAHETGGPGPSANARFNMTLDYAFFAEAFYVFAWRVRQCLRNLPGLGRFECAIIRDLRNQFIEHPERLGGKTGRGIAIGDASGPQLSIGRIDDEIVDTVRDNGLYVNAEVFRNAVVAALSRATHQR